ncbi:uncharacterized protein LOC131687722 [Topomyia yanbarensis]|uniref:uncharacterized protein LOC131687722 n=1 Tax=Topomyia yanbarensis TaxID=2498891 RepID=UPI00273C8DD1|nr:uncharacterized protein LOC131687722 [Topomyia yanbarensis]
MRLKSNTAVCPRIYGQPKAHKPNLPLRPVVSNITAPKYQLAKFIGSILKSSFHSEYNTPDSFQFTEYIQQATLPPDYVLVSFDVVSLYTNIPTELVTHDIIMDWRNIKVHTNINLDLFLELVEFCIKSSYFRFREKHYKQTFGTAMGSPLSPILADIIMENLLQTSIKRLPFTIPVIRKYVYDLFLALPKDKVQQTLDTFNAYNQHLQFTKEEEIDNKLSFLDTVVTRHSDQTLSTRWYAKPIASGRLLNYHSFHPLSMKMNVAQQFIKRVTGLTTDNCPNLQQNIIFQHLRRNNYPSSLINRLISRNAKIFCPSNNSQQPDKNKNASNTRDPPNDSSPSTDQVYRSLPYVPSLSTSILISLGEKTALIEHMIKNDHNFDLTKAKIIDKTYRSTALPILEMCHISNTANTVNHRTDVDGLNTTYAGILHTLKTTSTRRNRNTETSDDSCLAHNCYQSLHTQSHKIVISTTISASAKTPNLPPLAISDHDKNDTIKVPNCNIQGYHEYYRNKLQKSMENNEDVLNITPLPDNTFSCIACERPDSADNLVQCDKCHKWWHYSCAGVTDSIVNRDWICPRSGMAKAPNGAARWALLPINTPPRGLKLARRTGAQQQTPVADTKAPVSVPAHDI